MGSKIRGNKKGKIDLSWKTKSTEVENWLVDTIAQIKWEKSQNKLWENDQTKRGRLSHYYWGIKYPNGKDQAVKIRLRWHHWKNNR